MRMTVALLLVLLAACATHWNYPPKEASAVTASVMDSTDPYSGQRTISTPGYHYTDEFLRTIETWWLEWRGDAEGPVVALRVLSSADRGTTKCFAKGGLELASVRSVDVRGGMAFELLTIHLPEELYRAETKDGLELRAYGVAPLDIWIPKPVVDGFAAAVERRGLRMF